MSRFYFNQLVAIFDGDSDTGARGYIAGRFVRGEAPTREVVISMKEPGEAPTGEFVIIMKEPGKTKLTGCVIIAASRLRAVAHTNGKEKESSVARAGKTTARKPLLPKKKQT